MRDGDGIAIRGFHLEPPRSSPIQHPLNPIRYSPMNLERSLVPLFELSVKASCCAERHIYRSVQFSEGQVQDYAFGPARLGVYIFQVSHGALIANFRSDGRRAARAGTKRRHCGVRGRGRVSKRQIGMISMCSSVR